MPRTRFDPSLDGFPPGIRAAISSEEAAQMRGILDQARQEALQALRRAYYSGVQAFNLEHFTSQWVTRWASEAELQAGGYQAGILFAILDHFQAALPLPELATIETQDFRAYLQARNFDHLSQNVSAVLLALSIYSLIPEDWVPSQAVSERIRRAVSAVKMVDQVQIELDLGLAPGGKRWLDEQTRRSLEEVLRRIDSGQPCPAWLIRSPASLVNHNQVIVYAYDQLAEEKLLLCVYDLDCPGEANQILVEEAQGRLALLESCEERKPMTIQGLLLADYTPQPPPHASYPWWGELEFVRRIVWNSRHLWRDLQRRIRSEPDEGRLGDIPAELER